MCGRDIKIGDLKMKKQFNMPISTHQLWNGKKIKFEPDSSPKAWEHYKRVYNYDFGKSYNILEPCFYSNVFGKNQKVEGISCGCSYNGKYYNYVNKEYKSGLNRLYALSKKVSYQEKDDIDYFDVCIRLSGEVDFNFNEKHFPNIEWLLCREEDSNIREKSLLILEECKRKHYTLLNFSLMQTMGDMQGFKGKQCEDRLDKFLFFLYRYFQASEVNRNNTSIIQNASEMNRKYLMEYLNGFQSFAGYCEKIYFIRDSKFIDALVQSGIQPINTPKRAREYLDLANKFWGIKEKKYLDIYYNRNNTL